MEKELLIIAKTRGLLRDYQSINIRCAVKIIVWRTIIEEEDHIHKKSAPISESTFLTGRTNGPR